MHAKVEIINIGDELLIGQVVNTNASWMGEQLSAWGFEVRQMTTVSDQSADIKEAVELAMNRSAIILLSGGLGPTNDDITKKTLADFFNSEMYFNEEAFQNVKRLFKARGFQVSDVNKDQALLPQKAIAIPNENGTAYGMWFQEGEKVIVSMPGVPFEMRKMMKNHVLPRLNEKFKPQKYVHKTIMTQGMGESFLAQKIETVENNLPAHISLAYLPRPGIVRLRLSARGADELILKQEIQDQVNKIENILGDSVVFGYDDQGIEEALHGLLKNSGLKIATAESCTGGSISKLITSVPGSSEYF
ncbi:MAG: CinA family nicotinamide mononucleotide deamidase-related protein, partial [Bacteroidales bacterium]|nr:CinA family nicotinamide mononucleotide deamidase-related protein [Bacteroidales bacterium]